MTLVLMIVGVGIMLVAGVIGLVEGTVKAIKDDPQVKAAREAHLKEEERKRAWREKVGKSNADK